MLDPQARADHANRLLKDPLLIEAFEGMQKAIHEMFDKASVDDGKTLIGLKQRQQLLRSHWKGLEEILNTGKLDVWKSEQDEKPLSRIAKWKKRA